MSEGVGLKGLVFDEPLLWEKGAKGRCGISLPSKDTPEYTLDENLCRKPADIPELSELDVVRHYTRMSQWNVGVDSCFYPLGSCTMKYNPKINEKLASLRGFDQSHPLLPEALSQGIYEIMHELEIFLAEITGLDVVSLQPLAGAQGEMTGIMLIKAYHEHIGEKRTRMIIPDTAHGTNPASVALCGMTSVPVKSNENGILEPEAVKAVMDEETAGIMLTNPNTLGLFEENIKEIAEIVHQKGGLVYCDGANLNAVMGMVRMGETGIDVMHLNLHKTFSTPHGGGGPGAGPVCAVKKLEPFLPVPRVVKNGSSFSLDYNSPLSIGKVHAWYGNTGVLLRAYAYILSLGPENIRKASQLAVLNANYIKQNLRKTYHLPYDDRPCMHECVFTDKFQQANKITTLDIAKRLVDYGYHPPTMYFPLVVKGAIMIEPTETESKETIDGFIRAMEEIAREATENPSLLQDAPHKPKVRRLDETKAAQDLCVKD